jgi:outer membrane receptor protein involved in Fe transport
MRTKPLFWAISAPLLLLAFFINTAPLIAQEQQDEETTNIPRTEEKIQVTATRIPEAVEPEPAAITIVTGEELKATGAHDVATALSLVGGVSIAPGGDGGPASSVPELWGLREFDAFLLVVDDVPWGGAFNPALSTLDLNDIERIEVLRGPAPVMYGATSFVGVIHVIHLAASDTSKSVRADIGNYSTGGASVRVALPSSETWKHSIAGNFDQQGYRDDRTQFDIGHLLYRAQKTAGEGILRFDVDLSFLTQDPASPHPRAGAVLDPAVPLDANHNPSDAEQDENRYHFVGGYDSNLFGTAWSVIGAVTHADRDIIKGFLSDVSNEADPNTAGFRQNQSQTDFYLDTHFAVKSIQNVSLVFGADNIFSKGKAESENFDYHVNLDGTGAPNSFEPVVQERPQLEDERNFFGLYGQADWNLTPRFLVQGGLRLNITHEKQEGEVLPGDTGEEPDPGQEPGEEEGGEGEQNHTKLSGVVGASFLAVDSGTNRLWIFGDYRNTFKPAAVDFGPEAEGEILDPETAQSYEGGVKGEMGGRFDWQFSVFRMDFTNLVIGDIRNGLPVLINAGEERFTGVEFEGDVLLYTDLRLKVSYSHHNPEFRDFIQVFDGVPTQLAGKQLEMSPNDLAAFGVVYSPLSGINGSFILNYVGDRFLNKRNTALADAFTTISLGAGYRFGKNNIRFDIYNVTDERDPIAESELGDAQYYRMPARNFRVSWLTSF